VTRRFQAQGPGEGQGDGGNPTDSSRISSDPAFPWGSGRRLQARVPSAPPPRCSYPPIASLAWGTARAHRALEPPRCAAVSPSRRSPTWAVAPGRGRRCHRGDPLELPRFRASCGVTTASASTRATQTCALPAASRASLRGADQASCYEAKRRRLRRGAAGAGALDQRKRLAMAALRGHEDHRPPFPSGA
jgi:hypothetical protein